MENRLFTPCAMGNVILKNRLVVPPFANNLSNTDGTLSEDSLAYYTARAKGGFGLILLEAMVVDETARAGAHKAGIYSDAQIAPLKAVVDACHQYGAKVGVQLQHPGPFGNPEFSGNPLVSAWAVPRVAGQSPHPLTKGEIQRLVALYGEAGRRAKAAGADFIEVHAAHGYLLHSFLSPHTNLRNDEYGGSLKNRLRIVKEIYKAIKEQVGNIPLLCRINATDDEAGGITLEESVQIAQSLEKIGFAGIDVSRGIQGGTTIFADHTRQGGFNGTLCKAIKEAVHIPVIGVGRVTTKEQAEAMLQQDQCDLVALGRQSLCDPETSNKWEQGRDRDVLRCSGCMQTCVQGLKTGTAVMCHRR